MPALRRARTKPAVREPRHAPKRRSTSVPKPMTIPISQSSPPLARPAPLRPASAHRALTRSRVEVRAVCPVSSAMVRFWLGPILIPATKSIAAGFRINFGECRDRCRHDRTRSRCRRSRNRDKLAGYPTGLAFVSRGGARPAYCAIRAVSASREEFV